MKIIAVYESTRNSEGHTGKGILVWPDSVMIRSRKPLFLPDDGVYYIHEGIGARIDAVGKSIHKKFARRYYDEICAIAYILPESVSDCLIQKADPVACDIAADYTLICGDYIPALETETEINEAISIASCRNTLKTGDIVAIIFRERRKAERDSVLKISLRGNTLIENKLK